MPIRRRSSSGASSSCGTAPRCGTRTRRRSTTRTWRRRHLSPIQSRRSPDGERVMPTIRFETTDRDVQFQDGDEVNLLRVAIRNDCGVPFKCASGNCGTDRVRVLAGAENLIPSRKRERERLGELVAKGYRLACQTYVCGDVTIAWDP